MPLARERLLILTYRFGPDLIGGAERHLYELATRLFRQEGIESEIWTTTARGISPVAHWGTELTPGYPADTGCLEEGVTLRRFPLSPWPRAAVALGAKAIQRRWEREEIDFETRRLLPYINKDDAHGDNDLPDILPCTGWHFPEIQADGSILRWTLPRFTFLRTGGAPAGTLILSGYAPRAARIQVSRDAQALGILGPLRSWFQAEIPLPPSNPRGEILTLECDTFLRLLRDHRSLGILVSGVSFRPGGHAESRTQAHWEDSGTLLRRRWEDLMALYRERAQARPPFYNRMFDWTRGPRAPRMWKALRELQPSNRFHGVLAANLPWAVIPRVAEWSPLPFAALPLWHLDDPFYYWNHYVESLRKARVVLSNTEWAAHSVYPRMGINARWAGPGVDDRWAGQPPNKTSADWRRELGISPEAPVILSVSRKSPAKRYDILLDAMTPVRERCPQAVLVLVGPDEDHRPVDTPGVVCPGPMTDEQLHDAYSSADVFAMMSESESFGMVFVEAWLRGLPVVGNQWCRPVASLIDNGVDGLLVSRSDIAGALASLLKNPDRAREMGEKGKEKTLRHHTWTACTARVAQALRECMFQLPPGNSTGLRH